MNYIIVSPVRNEEESLYEVIRSMKNQTIRPIIWIIVDDGSTDRTPEIIKNAVKAHSWIKSIRLSDRGCTDINQYANVLKAGFDYIIEYSKQNNLQYDYLGIIDGDCIIDPDFFRNLVNEFKKDPKLGIASGNIYYETSKGLEWEESNGDEPRGTGRLWRRKCFEACGGIIVGKAPDTISNVKARLKGWNIKGFKDIKIIQTRRTSSATGLWRGWMIKGETSYFLNYHPIWASMRGIRRMLQSPYYIGIAYLLGYFKDLLLRKDQITDKGVRDYFWNLPKKKSKAS